jgi:hypothetical protein
LARIDDYNEALELASRRLKEANLHRLAKLAGARIDLGEQGAYEIRLPFLNRLCLVKVGDTVEISKESDEGGEAEALPILEKILIAHYILGASGEPPGGELITFREIPDGQFYDDAYQRRAKIPFLKTFGHAPELFQRCAPMLGGEPVEAGDVGMAFQVFPRITMRLVLWEGDEEFPPEATVLFDDNIHHYLSAEDIAVLSGVVVYPLIGMAKRMQAGELESQ